MLTCLKMCVEQSYDNWTCVQCDWKFFFCIVEINVMAINYYCMILFADTHSGIVSLADSFNMKLVVLDNQELNTLKNQMQIMKNRMKYVKYWITTINKQSRHHDSELLHVI